jgi:AraC-like DNA-binding protein
VDDLLEFVDKTMVKNISNYSGSQGSPFTAIRRPMTGGTNEGRRPARYNYWRVGYGDSGIFVLPFVIERAGEYHCRPAYLTGSIDHPDATQVYYHLEGDALFEQPKQTTLIQPGNVLIIPFGHVGYYRSESGMKYHWLSLGRHWPRERGERPSIQLLPLPFDSELADRFIEIRELLILQKTGYPLRAVGSFYDLLARIEELSTRSSGSLAQSPYPEAVRNAIMYLREHDSEPYDAAAVAQAVNLSQSHLRALFEKWVGESPRQFHTRSRIERAARLLRDQDLSVSAAAIQVGYGDARHFSRVFKAVTGNRPREWRRSEFD